MSNKIRILDLKNQPASLGRLEVLIGDEFQSVCVASDPKVIKFACNSLGFK